jgi:hypothetical protein
MSEPIGTPETPDLPEARGPHLPDAIARVPLPVWLFLALTVLAAVGRWQELSGLSLGSAISVVSLIAGSVPPIVAPLLGVALFARHPNAHRTMPSIAFGVALFAVLTVVDRLREPILQSIATLDPTFESTGPAYLGYGLVQALVSVFALTYLSIGLADARRYEDSLGRRTVLILLFAAAVGAPAVSILFGFAWLTVQPLSSIVSVVSVLATNLAWAYLGWNAYRGWSVGEEPGTGWALVTGAGCGYLLIAVLASVLSAFAWVSGASNSQPELVYEVYLLLGAGLAGVWLALLAAFAVGLPAVADEAASPDALEGGAGADEPS